MSALDEVLASGDQSEYGWIDKRASKAYAELDALRRDAEKWRAAQRGPALMTIDEAMVIEQAAFDSAGPVTEPFGILQRRAICKALTEEQHARATSAERERVRGAIEGLLAAAEAEVNRPQHTHPASIASEARGLRAALAAIDAGPAGESSK